jgi:hypothetical protein
VVEGWREEERNTKARRHQGKKGKEEKVKAFLTTGY